MTKLESQIELLKEANEKINSLVKNIIMTAQRSGTVLDPSTVGQISAIDSLVTDLEVLETDGNTKLLREAKAIYDRAIDAIEQQLKSDDIKNFSSHVVNSLKKAKAFLDQQSKNGIVGTMITKLDELSKAEADGTLEKRYNDNKIAEYDISIEGRENEEKQRIKPFNKILAVTHTSRELLDRYNKISEKIGDLDKEIQDLKTALAKPDITDEDKAAKKAKIKELEEKKIEYFESARKDEKDKAFEFDKSKETTEAYLKKVATILNQRIVICRNEVITALETIKDEEIDDGSGKKKISDYLKDYMDRAQLDKVDGLTKKISFDRGMVQTTIDQEQEHKDMEKLKEERQVYVDRNRGLSESSGVQQSNITVYKEKFNWRHPFKSLARMWGNRNKNANVNSYEKRLGPKGEKFILEELEKEMGKVRAANFRKQLTSKEKDELSVKVGMALDQQREGYYEYKETQKQQGDR